MRLVMINYKEVRHDTRRILGDPDPLSGHKSWGRLCIFLKKSLSDGIQRALTGFAAGVMVAASVWSLLIPAMEQAADLGRLALSLGIAIQNFPEGAIISMPLRAEGMKKGRAFWGGVLSGIVEPIGAVLTILAAGIVVPALPYLLSFAAGAMLYVVVEALIPEMSQGRHSNVGTVFFCGRLQRDDGTGCGTGIAHG